MSDNFDAIWLVSKLLVQMLKQHHSTGRTATADFELSYDDPLPLSEYFRCARHLLVLAPMCAPSTRAL
jgi:hypothetical protein